MSELTVPKDFTEVKADGVFYNSKTGEIVVCGQPEDDYESHNCDEMGCATLSHVLLRGYESHPKKMTIGEWEKIFNVKILDPDGFDRTDRYLREREFTREEFEQGMILSSIEAKFSAKAEEGEGE